MLALWMPSSNIPDDGLLGNVPHVDKLVHFTIFAVLAFLVSAIDKSNDKQSAFQSVLIVSLIAFSYSAILETGQLWVDGRSFDSLDLIVNLLGCIAGSLFYNKVT